MTYTHPIRRLPFICGTNSNPLLLPFLPAPFLDELLGSWLERVAAHNGFPAFDTFLRLNGIDDCHQLVDIPQPTEVWSKIFVLLDVDPKWALDSLSTYPYWRNLGSNPSYRSESSAGYQRLGNRRSFARHEFQFCPTCISRDMASIMMTYVRRAHQLPASAVCHLHGDQLISRCDKCEVIICPARRVGLRVNAICPCGRDLREIVAASAPHIIWRELAKFEFASLVCGHPALSQLQARLVLRDQVIGTGQIGSLFSCYYSGNAEGNSMLEARKIIGGSRVTASKIRTASAPKLCAGFVAAGFNHRAATALTIQSPEIIPAKKAYRKPWSRPENVEEAKQNVDALFKAGLVRTISKLRASYAFVYWLLVLEARDWLVYRYCINHPIRFPSVEKDRALLLDLQAGSPNARIAARARAFYRDRVWFDSVQIERVNESAARYSEQFCKLSVIREKFETQPTDPKPEKFTSESAATALGLSVAALFNLQRRRPKGSRLLYESPIEFRLRLLAWAVREALRKGERPSTWSVVASAGVPHTARLRFFAASAIMAFGCDEFGEPIGPLHPVDDRQKD